MHGVWGCDNQTYKRREAMAETVQAIEKESRDCLKETNRRSLKGTGMVGQQKKDARPGKAVKEGALVKEA